MIDKEFLSSLGVVDWGYTEEAMPRSFERYSDWVGHGQSAPLHYLSDHRKDLRADLRKVYPNFQSALIFLFNYTPTKKWMLENQHHDVAGYALGFGGEDYHHALKRRLGSIAESLKEKNPDLESFLTLDAQPVLERDLAFRAGLGWFGKNSMLINRKHGSYFLIGSLLLNQKLDLESSPADVDHCGQCNRCVEACPTHAIDPVSRTLSASQCISTFTIEIMKEAQAPKGFENSRGEIFGCDICQDVCPWNEKPLQKVSASLPLLPQYNFLYDLFYAWPRQKLRDFISSETNRRWRKKLSGTAFDRPGKAGWLKNLK